MADKMMIYKYVIKNVATKYGKTVTFMPKPLFGDNGSGMHTHISLWKGGKPLFAGNGYAGLSDMAMYAIGGLLKHAPAILAFSNPTTNSYKRLVPGYEAPVNLAYSQRNRSAAIRIPMYSPNPKAKRIEFRCPDPSCNPYLAFSAMLMAAHRRHPEQDRSGRTAGQGHLRPVAGGAGRTSPRRPARWKKPWRPCAGDHDFLLRGDVFTPGRDRHLDLVQDDKRSRGDAVAAASLRVLHVLRHLSRQGTRGWGLGAGDYSMPRGCVPWEMERPPMPSSPRREIAARTVPSWRATSAGPSRCATDSFRRLMPGLAERRVSLI